MASATARRMLRPRLTAAAVAAVCYIGLIANSTQASLLASGHSLDLTNATVSGWQYLREAVAVAITTALVVAAARQSPKLGLPLFIFGLYLAAAATVTILAGIIPVLSVLFGLRFVYMAALLLAVSCYRDKERKQLLRVTGYLLIPFLLVEAYLTVQQVRHGMPTLGTSRFGSRPWGTYSSADNLGLAALGLLALYMVAAVRYRVVWISLTLLICLLTGSRTAILGALLVLGGAAVAKWRTRVVAAPFALLLLYGAYTVASSRAVSGREITGEARFGRWRSVLSMLDGVQVLVGRGVGVGTNSLIAAHGTGAGTAAITDSTVVAMVLSLGLVGVALLITSYVWLVRSVLFERRLLLVPMVTLAALSFNVPELSPFNILMAVVLGCSVRLPHRSTESSTSRPSSTCAPSTMSSSTETVVVRRAEQHSHHA